MRTLNRPMFNMGGPIKEGVMHGIREPYKGGGAALVGNPAFPKTGGREHHYAWIPAGITAARTAAPRILPKALQAFKNIFRGTPTGQVPGWTPLTTGQKIKSWFGSAPAGKYFAGSPEGRLLTGAAGKAGWVGRKIGSGAKSLASSPLTVGAGALYGVPWGYKKLFGGDDAADPVTGVMKPGGYPKADKKTKEAQADFAEKQRDTRVQKYLDLMGYDQSRYDAISKALVDASKIISEKGTLKGDVTRDLINPIIQATSARLEKPKQIREAVGLMMVKGEIEKEMYEAKPGTILKNVQDMIKSGIPKDEAWAIATKESKGVVADLQGAIATGKMSLADWPAFVRATGAQHGEEVTVITEEEIKANPEKYATFKDKDIMEIVKGSPPGIYIIGSETVRIDAGGKATQLR